MCAGRRAPSARRSSAIPGGGRRAGSRTTQATSTSRVPPALVRPAAAASRTPGAASSAILDLRNLDAMAADLHAGILAAEVQEAAVRQHSTEVAGPVQPHAGSPRDGAKRRLRPGGILPVAHGERARADADLALADPLPAVVVEQDDLRLVHRVPEGRASGPRRVAVRRPVPDHVHLGRSETDVEAAAPRESVAVEIEVGRRDGLAPEPDDADAREVFAAIERRGEAAEHARDRVEDRDRLAGQELGQAAQARRRRASGGRLRAPFKRAPKMSETERPEAHGREQRQPVLGADPEGRRHLERVVEEVAVALHDPLRPPGGAGGEENVRELVGRNTRGRLRRGGAALEVLDAPRRREAAGEATGEGQLRTSRDHGRRLELGPHGREPRLREPRIQRDVESPGPQDAEHGREERRSGLEQERDRPGRFEPRAEGGRAPSRRGVEFGVCRDAPGLSHRGPVREPAGDPLEALADRSLDLGLLEGEPFLHRTPRRRRRSPGGACRTRRLPGRARADRLRRPSTPRTARPRPHPPSTRST